LFAISVVTLILKIAIYKATGVFMNNYTKLILAITLVISSVSVVHAQNDNRGKNGPPQRPTFESLDTNEDGDIDFDEFSSHEIPHDDHQTVFEMIDSDDNGVISNDEFVNHKPPQPRNRSEDQS
jgi:Ca2+-binding EF-hand superfamily protein